MCTCCAAVGVWLTLAAITLAARGTLAIPFPAARRDSRARLAGPRGPRRPCWASPLRARKRFRLPLPPARRRQWLRAFLSSVARCCHRPARLSTGREQYTVVRQACVRISILARPKVRRGSQTHAAGLGYNTLAFSRRAAIGRSVSITPPPPTASAKPFAHPPASQPNCATAPAKPRPICPFCAADSRGYPARAGYRSRAMFGCHSLTHPEQLIGALLTNTTTCQSHRTFAPPVAF